MSSTAGRILVVDDEQGIRTILRDLLGEAGYEVDLAASAEEALAQAPDFGPDVVLLDLHLPGMDGTEAASKLLAVQPELKIVVVTAYGSIRSAVELTKAGVYDYVLKPFDNDDLLATVVRAMDAGRLARRVDELEDALYRDHGFDEIVTVSDTMLAVFVTMNRVAPVTAPVLITGESGTGKELVARAIHRRGPRHRKPFVAVNCGAIPEGLVESEFFGHEAGAFTDARSRRIGSFEAANGGTLFLDEVGDLPPAAQAKLLRALQEQTIVRLGSTRPIAVDVRLIAATNVDLERRIAEGRFRKDLYYRLNVVAIRIPPLRERREDIPLLAEHFIGKWSAEMKLPPKRLAPGAQQRLTAYDWSGNVRELENIIQSAIVLCPDTEIGVEHLAGRLGGGQAGGPGGGGSASGGVPADTSLAGVVEQATQSLEKRLIEETLRECGGNKTRAAAKLGISRKTLFNKLKRYGI